MNELPYHNFDHVVDVFLASRRLSILERVRPDERFLLETAALLHDVIYKVGAADNEENSAYFAKRFLPKAGYTAPQIKVIADLILATKWPQNPRNHLQQVICDADLDHLGREDFFEKGERLREETGRSGSNVTKWYRSQLDFLKSHRYFTKSARRLRDAGKIKNIQELERLIQYSIQNSLVPSGGNSNE